MLRIPWLQSQRGMSSSQAERYGVMEFIELSDYFSIRWRWITRLHSHLFRCVQVFYYRFDGKTTIFWANEDVAPRNPFLSWIASISAIRITASPAGIHSCRVFYGCRLDEWESSFGIASVDRPEAEDPCSRRMAAEDEVWLRATWIGVARFWNSEAIRMWIIGARASIFLS